MDIESIKIKSPSIIFQNKTYNPPCHVNVSDKNKEFRKFPKRKRTFKTYFIEETYGAERNINKIKSRNLTMFSNVQCADEDFTVSEYISI